MVYPFQIKIVIKWALIGISVLLMILSFSCKTRQYDKAHVIISSDQLDVRHKDSLGSKSSTMIDTSEKIISIHSSLVDSSLITTTLIPADNSSITVNKDGSITGQFKSVITTHKDNKRKSQDRQETDHSGISKTTQQSSHTLGADSNRRVVIKDSTRKTGSSNSTVTANFPIKYALILIAAISLIVFLWYKFHKVIL